MIGWLARAAGVGLFCLGEERDLEGIFKLDCAAR